jgi:hypothetical protein
VSRRRFSGSAVSFSVFHIISKSTTTPIRFSLSSKLISLIHSSSFTRDKNLVRFIDFSFILLLIFAGIVATAVSRFSLKGTDKPFMVRIAIRFLACCLRSLLCSNFIFCHCLALRLFLLIVFSYDDAQVFVLLQWEKLSSSSLTGFISLTSKICFGAGEAAMPSILSGISSSIPCT